MGLDAYQKKRKFNQTPEPAGKITPAPDQPKFVVQEHHASHLHWDFRLEMGGVLKSWSVPKGPSLDPGTKRLAVEVEDHPVDYLSFKGEIPAGSYGAGEVIRWDIGTYQPQGNDPLQDWKKGSLKFHLNGKRLKGGWRLFKMKGRVQNGKPLWLLQKVDDSFAVAEPLGKETDGKRKPARSRFSIKAARIKRSPAPRQTSIPKNEFLTLELPKGDLVVDIDGKGVALTSLERIYWPEEKITKYDVLHYYLRIAPLIFPFLENRPAILQRYPRGITSPKFFQHDLQSAPKYLHAVRMQNEEGRDIDYAVYRDLPSLLHLVNLGTLEQHPWHSTLQHIDFPDWLTLDLDPDESSWKDVLKAALTAGTVCEERGLTAYPKSSGSRGIHLYIPLRAEHPYEEVSALAHSLAREITERIPDIATIERPLEKRGRGQVYIDWLQNSRGKSMAAPYSLRAKAGAPISMPLTWEQVEKGTFRISDFNIRTIFDSLEKHGDPWKEFYKNRQNIK